jgi:hypothetical protein
MSVTRIICEKCGRPHVYCECPKLEGQSELPATAGSATPATAYRDAEGWVLFDKSGNVIEDWPADWPQTVDAQFLKTKSVVPIGSNGWLDDVERALTKINEAEGYFLLGRIASGKNMLGDGKAMLEKLIEGRESTSSNRRCLKLRNQATTLYIGNFRISHMGPGKCWLSNSDGEGMETSEAKLAAHLEKYFKREF